MASQLRIHIPFMQRYFKSDSLYVWPELHGKVRGAAIEPFYPKQTEAVKGDNELYKLLSFLDVIRVGRRREVKVAIDELSKIMLHES